jgi:hypothetical protein
VDVHLSAASVDAASRRHKPGLVCSVKDVVAFVSSVNVPGIAPLSLLPYKMNEVSIVNSLISGGIEPVSLLEDRVN